MKQISPTKNSLVHTPGHHSINQQKVFSKYLFVLIAGFGMLITSCQKEELPGNPQQGSLSSAQNQQKQAVPFKANFVTSDYITSPANPPANPIQKDSITGTGEGTHIGKSTLLTFVVSDITLPFPALVTATGTITAANGDKIFMNSTGYVTEIDANNYIHATVTNTITGGTGRFTGATGSLIGTVLQSVETPAGTLSLNGTISY